MGNHQLKLAADDLAKFTPGQTIGLENRLNLSFMATGFTTSVVDTAKQFINDNLIAPLTPENLFMDSDKRLEKAGYANLTKFTIRTPEGVTGPMVPYLTVLDEALDDLMSVKSRLLEPLKAWCAKALANPGFIEKVWLERNMTYIDVDKHIAALAAHYDDKAGDDVSFAYIHDIYPRPSDFATAGDMVKDLAKESAIVLGQDIPKITEEIATLVRKLVHENETSDYMQKTPAASIAKLSEALYHAGREVELLSVVLFQTRIACVAYRETSEKINREL